MANNIILITFNLSHNEIADFKEDLSDLEITDNIAFGQWWKTKIAEENFNLLRLTKSYKWNFRRNTHLGNNCYQIESKT